MCSVHWSPYDRVGVVNADPEGLFPAHLSTHPSVSIPALGAFQLRLTPFNSTPTFACIERPFFSADRFARVVEEKRALELELAALRGTPVAALALTGLPTLPTPRTRARTSLRLSHGPAPAALSEDASPPAHSPATELRRRARAMGMRASPFAPKRKRDGK